MTRVWDSDTVEILLNSKLKLEKFEDARVLAESGDADDVEDAADGDVGDEGPNAVRRRRSELWRCRGWNRDGAILVISFRSSREGMYRLFDPSS